MPFSPEYLSLDEALPCGLRDVSGRLLLNAGVRISGQAQLRELQQLPLFAEESDSIEWMRRLSAAVNTAIRQGASLARVAAARPEAVREAAPAVLSLGEQWDELLGQLDAALRDVRPGSDWRGRLLAVHGRARQLGQRRTDASLYHLVYEAGQSTHRYSCNHALLTMLVCEQAAATLGWPQEWIDSLGRAALSMNVAMMRLQDQLASSQLAPTAEMRADIAAHAESGAQLLQAGGLVDALCVAVVRLHHETGDVESPLAALTPELALARLLRRVDIFTTKISRRASRPPMSPVAAAREACLSADGKPDEIGGALLRAVGLYPPGSFVELANGELGIVIARGRRANLPHVATLVSASGNPVGEPALRDTLDRRYSVKAAVSAASVKVRPPHERLLAMR